jgi:hypothetical protein
MYNLIEFYSFQKSGRYRLASRCSMVAACSKRWIFITKVEEMQMINNDFFQPCPELATIKRKETLRGIQVRTQAQSPGHVLLDDLQQNDTR